MDVVQFMKQWHFSFYHDEEAVRHLIHRQRPFYSMIPRDEWDDGIQEFAPFDQSNARPLNNKRDNPTYHVAWMRKNKKFKPQGTDADP